MWQVGPILATAHSVSFSQKTIHFADMSNLYRIYPVLWTEAHCDQAQTVYAIDRCPNTFRTVCSHRVKEDPAYHWDNPTFQRLLPPSAPGCFQPSSSNSVRWNNLPAWLSYVSTLGYTLQGDTSSLQPMREFFLLGP
jgi:hypothetical protein